MTVDEFIERWSRNEGGAERANFPLFLTELCALLELPQPDPADATHDRNDYVFERAVTFRDAEGKTGHGRIDLYRRNSFVLEAKQSRQKGGAKEVALAASQQGLPGMEAPQPARGRRSAHRGWDVLMRNAREQAEQYARALPENHVWPPFILVCDVGHAIEVFADFSGQGRNYRQFPDRAGFRIYLEDLRQEHIRERLRAIWLDPHALDPAKHSAEVTRDISKRLAAVSKRLEDRGHEPERVAHFLMRVLFTMFAEDSGLLEQGSFLDVLGDARSNPDSFGPMLEELWKTMDAGGFSTTLRKTVRKFNGGLFAERTAIPLHKEEIGELYEAAKHVWTDVEPAIFGTLLEQALDKDERRRLGAHYTPRAYVERLVEATVIQPLKAEWEGAVLGAVELERETDPTAAIRLVHDFHVKLARTRVLDPACGTGNFLYVALELMKRLEGDVLEVLADLGGQEALAMETETVHPRNFLGMELNPRAAAIAELVLWLGYLQWQMRNKASISDPVLEKLSNITPMDAVVKHDPERPKADGSGTELPNPRRPVWPEAEYIVGNPPFIGAKWLRSRLGDAYSEALWKAHPKINKSADFVMYWWDRAAEQLTRKGSALKRFGFVTTNSITQEFSRRVIAKRMEGRPPVSLVMAIPDHPWTKATKDAAAVRIAMTVARLGTHQGVLLEVISEQQLESDAPEIILKAVSGDINTDLTVGVDVSCAKPLLANGDVCGTGVKLHGSGFIVSRSELNALGLGKREAFEKHVRKYSNARDLIYRSRDAFVIDLFGLSDGEVRQNFPELYQHVLTNVKPERDLNNRSTYRDNWWIFGEPRRELRPALENLKRYIVAAVVAKYRVFQFLEGDFIPDVRLACFAFDDSSWLGVLSSKVHLAWASVNDATLEDRPTYITSRCFDPFPFPDTTAEQRQIIGDLAEELDATRKEVLAEHGDLTLTGLYNLREKVKAGAPLDMVEQDQRRRGRVDIIAELHDRIDDAVADAYGWPRDLSDEAIVERLVALNAERHAEEKAGKVRWLRPDYQIAKAGLPQLPAKSAAGGGAEQIEALLPEAAAKKPAFPRDAIGQTAAVLTDLRSGGTMTAEGIARRYSQGRKVERRIASTLEALMRLGHVAADGDGYRLRKVA
ncbi:DNA methyltransferase [Sphingomonas sp.]|uniref:DNA methyltransferase n=1 Tax=Sphingomonas sp. TaxID=28214 RepID=UPI0017D43220|nr:DNA methyltransferase [Sphingomonas sp.]MBA4763668.1 class I SAM-dependent DNA methyltransferase [Sphingomonas sp.]